MSSITFSQLVRHKKSIIKNKNNYILLFLLLIICVSTLFAGRIVFAQDTKKVLFVSSYSAGYDTLPDQVRGIMSVFEPLGIAVDIEYMDTKRYPTKENLENFHRLLKYKFDSGVEYDVILIGDDNALQFFLDHEEIYPDLPKIFFCVNDLERAQLASKNSNITGIVEALSTEENLEFARALMPKGDTFVAIVDDTQTGIGDIKSFSAAAEQFPDMKVEWIDVSTMTFEEVGDVLSKLDEKQILFYLSMFEDREGHFMDIREAVDLIVSHSAVPVFRMSIGGVSEGLLGGKMVSYFGQGKLAAQMAVEVLNGKSVKQIQIIDKSPNKFILNYQVFEKYNLDKSQIPLDAILINKPLGFFEKYQKVLIPMISIMGIFLMIIILVIRDNLKQRMLKNEIRGNRDEITALYEQMAATEEELRNNYDELVESKSALERSEARYRGLAYTDTLTGLKNRLSIFEQLDYQLEDPANSGVIFYIDLDNFKFVNNAMGHDIGDEVLKVIGARLLRIEDERNLVARLGGDDFIVVCLDQLENSEIVSKATYISKLISNDFECFSRNISLTCSMGIAVYPEHGNQSLELLKKIDIALYRAKDRGRNHFVIYNQEMETDVNYLMEMQNNIRKALQNHEFRLHYQPQIDLKTKEVIGLEALIRWYSPNSGIIYPDKFIPVAEQLGLINMIDEWVQKEVCGFIKRVDLKFERIETPLKISINISAVEMARVDFTASMLEVITRLGVNPNRIVIEITESAFIEAMEESVEKLNALRAQGIEIHLDDFGTGYSSLTYLAKLPIDTVKLDRGFVKDLELNTEHQKMVYSIVKLIQNLDKKIIVEGVENIEQLKLIEAMGCNIVQGYYFERPLPEDQILSYLTKR